MPQLGQRTAADDAQHFVVAPLALRSLRTELSFHQAAALHETLERRGDHGDAESIPPGHFVGRERTMSARKAKNKIARRIGNGLEKPLGDFLRRQRNTQRIAIAARVFDGDPALLARDRDFDDAVGLCKLKSGGTAAALQARSRFDLLGGQIAEAEEQVMNSIDRLRLVPLVEVLQLHLHLGQHVRVEELAQLGLAEKLTKLGLIDRQRLRLPFGQRRVAVVDEIRHVAEKQRSGKG